MRLMTNRTAACLALAICAAASLSLAGDLNPPAGPVAPTLKTLTEVEPRTAINATNTPGDASTVFRISQPGSYYLTGNVAGETGKDGITIASANVTLDLMGFALEGTVGAQIGIVAVGGGSNITVRNGTVAGWGDGVNLTDVGVNMVVEHVTAKGNGNVGFLVLNGMVRECQATNNLDDGFRAVEAAFRDCVALGNGENGFDCAGSLARCVANLSGQDGFDLTRATVTDCQAFENSGSGFRLRAPATLSGCNAGSNLAHGISAEGSVPGMSIVNCVVSYNSLMGVFAVRDASIVGCVSTENGDTGFDVGTGSVIRDCTATENSGDGILLDSAAIASNNTCNNNDAAGIHALGFRVRIEGNNSTQNGRGIEVDGTGNFIARNTCSGNGTNWDVAGGNVCLVVSATTAAVILGNSGGAAPGSTDPNANFSY